MDRQSYLFAGHEYLLGAHVGILGKLLLCRRIAVQISAGSWPEKLGKLPTIRNLPKDSSVALTRLSFGGSSMIRNPCPPRRLPRWRGSSTAALGVEGEGLLSIRGDRGSPSNPRHGRRRGGADPAGHPHQSQEDPELKFEEAEAAKDS